MASMRLLCTPNSLYSRIIRVVALELGVDLPIEFVGVRNEAGELLEHNPAGKVPTLVLTNGSVLAESRPICEYLESLSERQLLAEISDFSARELESIVAGFVDGLAVWIREERREIEDQSASIIELERARAARCLVYFNGLDWSGGALSYARISLIAALELMTLNVDGEWLGRFPTLAGWYQDTVRQEVFVSTRPEAAG